MKRILTVLLLFCSIVLFAQDCDCEDGILEEEEADLIFEGKAQKISETKDGILKIEFEISHVEKGEMPSDQCIYTFLDIDCGYPFAVGKEYIVQAIFNPTEGYCGEAGSFHTTYCTYTMSFEEWDAIFGN